MTTVPFIGEYIINFMAIGLAVALLVILGIVYVKGEVLANEPRRWILITELAIMVAIVGLAIYNITRYW